MIWIEGKSEVEVKQSPLQTAKNCTGCRPPTLCLILRRDSFDEWAAKRQQNREEAETMAPVCDSNDGALPWKQRLYELLISIPP